MIIMERGLIMAINRRKKKEPSGEMLASGISEGDFLKLLNDIRNEVRECNEAISNHNAVFKEMKKDNPGPETDARIENIKTQINDSNHIISENLKNIEDMFDRIFNDWKEYQIKNNIKENAGDSHE